MPTVSLIIPIYNQEVFLKECLDNIVAQTFTDFEVILVDDGSTDSSRQIYDEYAQNDHRFFVINKSNGGVSSARNLGLQYAQGKYVVFVDADDILPKDSLNSHICHISDDIDLTVGGMSFFVEKSTPLYCITPEKSEKKSISECLMDFTPGGGGRDWQRYMVNRMMRMSIIKENNLRFDERIAYKEDGLFLVQYLLKCKGQVAYFPETVYCYRQNPSSAMGALDSGKTKRLVTNIDAHAQIIKEMRRANVAEDILNREIAHAFNSRHWVLDKLIKTGNFSKRVWFETLWKLSSAIGLAKSVEVFSKIVRNRFRVDEGKNA